MDETLKNIEKFRNDPELRRLNINFDLVENFINSYNKPVSSELITEISKANDSTKAVLAIVRIWLNGSKM